MGVLVVIALVSEVVAWITFVGGGLCLLAFAFARVADGTRGVGEASPAAYVTGEDQASVCAAAGTAGGALLGEDAHRWARWEARLREALPDAPTARSAVEMAVLDAAARQTGVPLWKTLGGAVTRVVTDLSIPICPPAEAAERAAVAFQAGFRHIKIKVGGADRAEGFRTDREPAARGAWAAAARAPISRMAPNQSNSRRRPNPPPRLRKQPRRPLPSNLHRQRRHPGGNAILL